MKLTTKISLAFLLLLLGISYAQSTRPPAQLQTSSGNAGRYQIVMSPVLARNTFLLDSQTGKVWQLAQFSELKGEPTVWMAQTRLDSEQELMKWVLAQAAK